MSKTTEDFIKSFPIVWVVIIVALLGIAGVIFYPKEMIKGGPRGLILPEQTYYSEEYRCLGFEGRRCPSVPYADISCEAVCYGLRYKKQCFKSIGVEERTMISCDELPRREPPPSVTGKGRSEEISPKIPEKPIKVKQGQIEEKQEVVQSDLLGISPEIKRTAVLLINFLDSPSIPRTKDEMTSLIFHGQVEELYREQSYGKISWRGDVFGWYTLDREGQYPDGTCVPPSPFEQAIQKLIIDQQIDLANYQHLIFISNHQCGGNESMGKSVIRVNNIAHTLQVARIGLTDDIFVPLRGDFGPLPFNWTAFDNLLAHELGHNLGAPHANSWVCLGGVLQGESCHQILQGNLYDTMANGQYAKHFNALIKDKLGWLDPSSIVTITATGRYTIRPFENNRGIRAAKIIPPGQTVPLYYLEYRQPIGFDAYLAHPAIASNTKGLFINWNADTRLLDLTPTSGDFRDWEDVTLNVGEGVFEDKKIGLRIGPVIEATPSSITFEVTIK